MNLNLNYLSPRYYTILVPALAFILFLACTGQFWGSVALTVLLTIALAILCFPLGMAFLAIMNAVTPHRWNDNDRFSDAVENLREVRAIARDNEITFEKRRFYDFSWSSLGTVRSIAIDPTARPYDHDFAPRYVKTEQEAAQLALETIKRNERLTLKLYRDGTKVLSKKDLENVE